MFWVWYRWVRVDVTILFVWWFSVFSLVIGFYLAWKKDFCFVFSFFRDRVAISSLLHEKLKIRIRQEVLSSEFRKYTRTESMHGWLVPRKWLLRIAEFQLFWERTRSFGREDFSIWVIEESDATERKSSISKEGSSEGWELKKEKCHFRRSGSRKYTLMVGEREVKS